MDIRFTLPLLPLPPLLLPLHHNLPHLLVLLHRPLPHPQESQHHQLSCLVSHQTTWEASSALFLTLRSLSITSFLAWSLTKPLGKLLPPSSSPSGVSASPAFLPGLSPNHLGSFFRPL